MAFFYFFRKRLKLLLDVSSEISATKPASMNGATRRPTQCTTVEIYTIVQAIKLELDVPHVVYIIISRFDTAFVSILASGFFSIYLRNICGEISKSVLFRVCDRIRLHVCWAVVACSARMCSGAIKLHQAPGHRRSSECDTYCTKNNLTEKIPWDSLVRTGPPIISHFRLDFFLSSFFLAFARLLQLFFGGTKDKRNL